MGDTINKNNLKIFFDMDGVLADFDNGVINIAKFKKSMAEFPTEEEDTAMWAAVAKIDHFYDVLEPMPGAKEMFDTIYSIYKDKCEVLTGIPKPRRGVPTAGEDKISWMHRMMDKDIKVNIVFTENKPQFCAGKDSILIDDFPSNIKKWEAIGGTGILHTSAENTLNELKKLGVL